MVRDHVGESPAEPLADQQSLPVSGVCAVEPRRDVREHRRAALHGPPLTGFGVVESFVIAITREIGYPPDDTPRELRSFDESDRR